MSLKIATVWSSISALSVSNLTIKDIDDVTETWEVRGAVLYPDIQNPVAINVPKRQSFGTGASVKRDVTYTMNYRFLYQPVGTGRGIKDIFSGMFVMVANLFDAVIAADPVNGSIDIVPRIASTSTTVLDPSGNQFYGLDIAFDVLEYQEL